MKDIFKKIKIYLMLLGDWEKVVIHEVCGGHKGTLTLNLDELSEKATYEFHLNNQKHHRFVQTKNQLLNGVIDHWMYRPKCEIVDYTFTWRN